MTIEDSEAKQQNGNATAVMTMAINDNTMTRQWNDIMTAIML